MKRILAATAALLALSACGSQDPPSAAGPSSAPPAPTTKPTPSGPVPPTMPAAARQRTKAGAIAFAKYYWRVVDYATATLDTTPLRRLRLGSCGQCRGSEQWLHEVRKAHGRIHGLRNSLKVDDVFIPKERPGTALVTFHVTSSAGQVVAAGKLNKTYRRGTSGGQFTLAYQRRGWVIAGWRVS